MYCKMTEEISAKKFLSEILEIEASIALTPHKNFQSRVLPENCLLWITRRFLYLLGAYLANFEN